MLTEEEFKQVKEQLFNQIENFPDEEKQTAMQQIESMNPEQLEEFLIKNNLIKQGNCIFCSIAGGETLSYKVAENKEAIAVLDINPLSRGQILIIPKQHKPIEECPEAMKLAQESAKLLKTKLKADEVKTESSNVQGHGIINVIPIYKGKKLEKKKAEDKEMYELQQILIEQEKTEEKEEKKSKEREIREPSDLPKAPRRIP